MLIDPNKLFFTFGSFYAFVPILVKIDQEICDNESAHRRTDRRAVSCYML